MHYEKISRRLAYLLRHSQEPRYVDLKGGWASVPVILEALGITIEDLDVIVATDRKGRYSYNDTRSKIRANQGHSIPEVVLDMEQPVPPEYLYHGTATRFLDAIFREGLKPMSRQWVHISPDYDTAVAVGKRHGTPAVLRVHARAFAEAGHPLYRSENGVWQAHQIPPEFFDLHCQQP